MNICTICHRPSLNISFDQPFCHEKLPYIESVCSALIHSRFGTDRQYQYPERPKSRSAFSVILDLGSRFLAPMRRTARKLSRLIGAIRSGWQNSILRPPEVRFDLLQSASQIFASVLTANFLGRGSPMDAANSY